MSNCQYKEVEFDDLKPGDHYLYFGLPGVFTDRKEFSPGELNLFDREFKNGHMMVTKKVKSGHRYTMVVKEHIETDPVFHHSADRSRVDPSLNIIVRIPIGKSSVEEIDS